MIAWCLVPCNKLIYYLISPDTFNVVPSIHPSIHMYTCMYLYVEFFFLLSLFCFAFVLLFSVFHSYSHSMLLSSNVLCLTLLKSNSIIRSRYIQRSNTIGSWYLLISCSCSCSGLLLLLFFFFPFYFSFSFHLNSWFCFFFFFPSYAFGRLLMRICVYVHSLSQSVSHIFSMSPYFTSNKLCLCINVRTQVYNPIEQAFIHSNIK